MHVTSNDRRWSKMSGLGVRLSSCTAGRGCAEQREREAILRDVELAEQDAETEARLLEARQAAVEHGAAADEAAGAILGELRAEVDRTRHAKAELRAQQDELQEYIDELRGAPSAAAPAEAPGDGRGGDAGDEECRGALVHAVDSRKARGRVLRDMSNSSGGGAFPPLPLLVIARPGNGRRCVMSMRNEYHHSGVRRARKCTCVCVCACVCV